MWKDILINYLKISNSIKIKKVKRKRMYKGGWKLAVGKKDFRSGLLSINPKENAKCRPQ